MIVRDHKDAAALAAEGVRNYQQCTRENEAGSRCVYGDGHRVESHLFDDGTRSEVRSA